MFLEQSVQMLGSFQVAEVFSERRGAQQDNDGQLDNKK
jgi:hypothetical protein